MSDLSNLISSDTFTLDVRNPKTKKVLMKSDGKPMTITIYSPYSDKFRQVAHEQAKKRINKGRDTDLTIDEYYDFNIETLAATVQSWDIQFGGEALAFSVAAAKDLFKKLPWLVEDIREAQDNTANFFND